MKMKQMISAILGLLLLLCNQSFAAPAVPYSWQNVAIGGGGFVSSVIAAPNDPDVFYARTDVGGAYRWQASSQSWIPLFDWVSSEQKGYLGVDGIAIDPNVPGRVYALLGTGYWNNGRSAFVRSDDYGETWDVFDVTDTFKAHGNGMGRGNGERLMVDPNNSNTILVGTRFDGLWKSTNRGSSWTKLSLDYTPEVDRGIHESGVCTLAFDPGSEANGASRTIYAGVSRERDNVYVSHDAGATWSLVPGQPTAGLIRPQRFALTSDGRYLYITYANGGGPHPMLWSGVTDYFNRGAIYKYDTREGTWTDISPENFMLNLDQVANDEYHLGAFSGISIDPNDENVILATSINSWRGPQFWDMDGQWVDAWGDNIYLSEDGGATWREMFRYYWMDGGFYPDYKMVDENGYPWIKGQAIHWNSAIVIDPNNSDRAFVVSGNGVFSTDNLRDSYTTTEWVDNVEKTLAHGRATWKFTSRGIEETVPLDLVSLPGGPLVSVIGDYDGFVHEDLNQPSPHGRLATIVNGAATHVGTTTGLAYAAGNPDILAKAGGNSATVYNQDVSICGVSLSSDGGMTWNQIYSQPISVSVPPASGSFAKGEVALSADGTVVLWSPMSGDTYHPELFRYVNSGWSKCQGVAFSCNPEADQVNADWIYAYNKTDGYMYVSVDKGAVFNRRGYAGTSDYWTMRSVPGVAGDLWVPLANGGLARSTDAGQTFTHIDGVSWCEAVGFGKAAPGADFPTVFIHAAVDGVTGVYRSTDQGVSWVRVNDDEHEYGGPGDASLVIGDMNVFGRVYMTTAGRGIVYGEPAGSTVAVAGVRVAPASATINFGDSLRIIATVSPANATNKAVTWQSSDETVASVSVSGMVTGQGAGQATITAITADGGFTAAAQIDVVAASTPTPTPTPTPPPVDTQHTLTTQTVGGGTITRSPGATDGLYDAGTVVVLTATPAEGYQFDGWSGDATGSSSTISITMDADRAVTASFIEGSATGGCDEGGATGGCGN